MSDCTIGDGCARGGRLRAFARLRSVQGWANPGLHPIDASSFFLWRVVFNPAHSKAHHQLHGRDNSVIKSLGGRGTEEAHAFGADF